MKLFRKNLVAERDKLRGTRLADENAGSSDIGHCLSELRVMDAIIAAIPACDDNLDSTVASARELETRMALDARTALEKVVKVVKSQDRLELWAHLVSMHAGIYSLELTFEQLDEIHEHEHKGPGTIRNHPPYARHADLDKIGKVLSEGEPRCSEVIIDSQGIFRVCTLEPGHEGKHHG